MTDISSQPELFRQQEESTAGMWGYYASDQKSSIKIQVNPGKFRWVEEDKYVFKIPVLRNVEMTPPYFHDGSIDSLPDAVFIMAKVQLARTLTAKEIDDIVLFLESLTGRIPDDALKVPLLPQGAMED